MSDADMLDEHYRNMGWSDSGIHVNPVYQEQQLKIMEETRARDAAQNTARHNDLRIANTASVLDKGTVVQATQNTTKNRQDIFQRIRKGLHMQMR